MKLQLNLALHVDDLHLEGQGLLVLNECNTSGAVVTLKIKDVFTHWQCLNRDGRGL